VDVGGTLGKGENFFTLPDERGKETVKKSGGVTPDGGLAGEVARAADYNKRPKTPKGQERQKEAKHEPKIHTGRLSEKRERILGGGGGGVSGAWLSKPKKKKTVEQVQIKVITERVQKWELTPDYVRIKE